LADGAARSVFAIAGAGFDLQLAVDHDVDTITTLVNRAVLALLAASLGIGSVLLLRSGADGREVTVDEVLGYIGLAVSAVLTLRIVAGVVRDGRS